jgi:hypothetical protein
VDYVDAINFQPNNANNPATAYASVGKVQPYSSGPANAAASNFFEAAQTQGALNTKTSFGLSNTPLPTSGHYDWLVHLDRLLTSPTEILQVSGFHPHELTHQFIRPGPPVVIAGHRVPWYDQTNRLYRIFELLETHDRLADVSVAGRIPGRVNINTIFDKRILRSLADPQTSNFFATADVDNVFTNLIAKRTPNLATTGLSASDQPFLATGIGFIPAGNAADPLYPQTASSPGGSGIANTLLAPGTGATALGPSAFQVPGVPPGYTSAHPYLQDELLNKIFSKLTTRSNVFAVWCTVGFFRVIQESDPVTGAPVRPVKLGEEMGSTTGTAVRHQMFAIIDRSNLTIAPTITATQAAITTIGQQPVLLGRLTNIPSPAGELPWQITAGSVLIVDTDANQETVVVTGVDTTSNTIVANFTKQHVVGASISVPGNPGPQPLFDLRDTKYAPVVSHWVVIN